MVRSSSSTNGICRVALVKKKKKVKKENFKLKKSKQTGP
jgi:hypothetical protein